jgi:CheY-like chemotaxis protein
MVAVAGDDPAPPHSAALGDAGRPPDPEHPADSPEASGRQAASTPMSLSILVVDDSAVSRSLVIKSLPPEWDVCVTQASNGSEALAKLNERPHAVVLLDLNMPVMDGYQFLEAINQSSAARPIVIVLSGDVQPRAQARVRELGANAFVRKPVRPENVREALRECGVL